MTLNANKRRIAFAFGLLAVSVGSVASAADPNVGDVIENSIKMKLAYIPPGEFDMGSPESETGRFLNHEELHHVKLTNGFYLGKYEVTQSQFQRVLKRNPSYFSIEGTGNRQVTGKDVASFPVEFVTWYDAVEFCNALSKIVSSGLTGGQFRGARGPERARLNRGETGGQTGRRSPRRIER